MTLGGGPGSPDRKNCLFRAGSAAKHEKKVFEAPAGQPPAKKKFKRAPAGRPSAEKKILALRLADRRLKESF
jgi:hypothetical protein